MADLCILGDYICVAVLTTSRASSTARGRIRGGARGRGGGRGGGELCGGATAGVGGTSADQFCPSTGATSLPPPSERRPVIAAPPPTVRSFAAEAAVDGLVDAMLDDAVRLEPGRIDLDLDRRVDL